MVKIRIPSFQCQECETKYYNTKSAETASRNGCRKCKGVDIDLYVPTKEEVDSR